MRVSGKIPGSEFPRLDMDDVEPLGLTGLHPHLRYLRMWLCRPGATYRWTRGVSISLCVYLCEVQNCG